MTFRDEGFFQALQQDPDDNTLRLVYADNLEERSDDASVARAELIRVQVELSALAPQSEQVPELTARQNDLLSRWQRVWLGDWADVLSGWTFRRGFVEAVEADTSVFLDQAANWFAVWPTLTVAKLNRLEDHLPELAASPWLAHLRGLDLSDNGIDADALVFLTESRFICLLQALDLTGNPIGPRGAGLLASARWADELTELHLGSCELWHEGLEALLGTRTGRRSAWRRLDLSNNGLYRLALVRLVDSPLMRNLVSLDLAGNPLRDRGASVLADSPNSAGLVDLGLAGTGTGDAELTALASSPHLPKLQSLDLRRHLCWPQREGTGVDRSGIGELSRSLMLGQLRRLLLGHGLLTSNGWTAAVLSIARPPRHCEIVSNRWVSDELRNSRYFMPSQLIECDLDELWWLGDTSTRERLPPASYWLGDDPDQVLELLGRMEESQAAVLRLRFGADDERPRTLKEIGELLGLSPEHVGKTVKEALAEFNKLQACFRAS
jgi:uncharacterized protein (TIGR02996 family)